MSSLGTVLKLFNPIPFTFRSQEEKEASTAIKYLRQASGTEREDEALSHVVNSLRTFYAKKTDTQKAAGLLIVAAKIQGARAHNNKPIMMRKASRLIVAEAESAGPKVFEDALKQARDHYTTKSKVKNISYWISMLGSGVAIIGAIFASLWHHQHRGRSFVCTCGHCSLGFDPPRKGPKR